MSDFTIYFELGWQHILDINGYDHILFVLALCASYTLTDWRKVLLLVTAFTVGHSLTLALSVWNVVNIRADLIELLIPVTILVTALSTLLTRGHQKRGGLVYAYALFFGLIHGLGFSNYLKSLLGKTESILGPLFAFNLGLELGQLVIVTVVLVVSHTLVAFFSVGRRDWSFFLSSAIFGIALVMTLERI
jgi:hypothetical protein